MNYEEVMAELKSMSHPTPKDLAGMARFGINIENAWCISAPNLRKLGKKIGHDQGLAVRLWKTEIHEARWLVSLVAEPDKLTPEQADAWVADLDSWDTCDGMCMNLLDKTPYAYEKAIEWSKREEEFVKRTGFALMAALAVHDKKSSDEKFYPFLERIKEEATDERNYVRKAVNWALRQIGKSRTRNLYNLSLETAEEILKLYPDSKSARWIARDTIRELTKSDFILKRFDI